MRQIELEYRHLKEYSTSHIEAWAKFYGLKLLYGMCLIVRDEHRNSDLGIIKFLEKIDLGHKKGEIHG